MILARLNNSLSRGEEPTEELHCTLCYLGTVDEFTPDIEHLKATVAKFASDNTPIGGSIGGLGRFCPSEHSEGLSPIIALINVPGLQEFRRRLASILDSAGVFVANNFDYTPHCTLCYVDPDAPMPIQNIKALPLTFDTIWLCIGDECISYPLGKLPDQTYYYKFEMIGKDGNVIGEIPHAQDDRRADGGPWSAEEFEWFKKNYTGASTSESIGDHFDWSDTELDKLAAIGPDDLTNAVKLWNENAPDGFSGLLNAEVEK